jgi:hypothetical protein
MNVGSFLALLDNFELETGIAETVTTEEVYTQALIYMHTYMHAYITMSLKRA